MTALVQYDFAPAQEHGMGLYVSATRRFYQNDEFIVLKPRVPVQRCELLVFVLRDFSHVFVGGGEHGFDSLAREADTVEIKALFERFGWPELQQALAKRNSGGLAAR